jgi:hypothetical protein
MFTGFKHKFPEYEVVTPHTNRSFRLRSMTVQEEERLKGSLLSPSVVTDHLNRCIFECIVKKPESIRTFDDFLSLCTLKDRDALLYGLYHITYEEVRNYDVTCGKCGKTHPITIKASSTFNMNSYPEDKNILDERLTVQLPIMESVTATLKQPTLKDEVDAMKYAGSNSQLLDLVTETLIIESFIENTDGVDSAVYSTREDIVDAYRSLTPNDKRAIFKEYKSKLGSYGIELKMRATCVHCGEEEDLDLDLVDNFFRMVHTLD